jgi:hypothetical protein
VALKGALHDEPEQIGIALAVLEQRAAQYTVKLFANGASLGICFGNPRLRGVRMLFQRRTLRTTTPAGNYITVPCQEILVALYPPLERS